MQSKTLVALVIQARNSSTRFPFKIMKDLCGKNILERILERVKKVKLIDEIIVATTKREEDDIIVNIAKKNAVSYFRGSTNNLIDRYYKAVKDKKFSHILRLPSDNPIPDFEEFDRLIKYHINSKNDFSSNICDFLNNGYPDGIGVEIYSLKTIKKIWELEKNKYNQEHITPCIYNYLKSGRMSITANHAFDYLYVDDLISAIEHFVSQSSRPLHTTYNVCNGYSDRFYSILSDVIFALGGSPSQIDISSTDPTNYIYSGDSSLFQNEFNYTIKQTSYSQAATIMHDWLAPIIDSNN